MRFHNSSYMSERNIPWASITEILRRNKVGLRTRVLECAFDEVFNLVPVVGLNTLNAAIEVLLDLAQHVPLLAVRNKGDSHADTTETTSTTNPVKVGLVIRFTGARAALVCLWDILNQVLV